MTPSPQQPPVPVIDRAGAPELLALLQSSAVQRLIADRVDVLYLTTATSYAGRAFVERRAQGGERRGVRVAVNEAFEESEYVLVLSHEVAHHVAGLRANHGPRWRRACADLLREAGRLGLLTPERVKQGAEMVLYGAVSRFRGWPERAAQRRQAEDRRRRALLERLRAAGLELGAQVEFSYRGVLCHGEVIRVNRKTVTVGHVRTGDPWLRVPFERILRIADRGS